MPLLDLNALYFTCILSIKFIDMTAVNYIFPCVCSEVSDINLSYMMIFGQN